MFETVGYHEHSASSKSMHVTLNYEGAKIPGPGPDASTKKKRLFHERQPLFEDIRLCIP